MSNVIPMPRRSPQLENGYMRLANELTEAILAYPLKYSTLRVLIAVLRKTYGYEGKKEDDISASQLGALCGGMSRQHVTTALNELAAQNVIHKRPGQHGMIVGINKDYAAWRGWAEDSPNLGLVDSPNLGQVNESRTSPNLGLAGSPNFGQVSKNEGADSPNLGLVDSPNLGHTKDNFTKNNTTKEKNICAPQADRVSAKPARAGQTGRAMTAETQARFERFYAAYPRKRSRGVAEKAFARINPDDELLEAMLAAIEVAKRSEEWANGFIKHPGSWLNAKGWLDHIDTAYSALECEVIGVYNDALGADCGRIDPDIYTPARAARIRDFLALSDKEDFWRHYFPWVRDHCNLPTHVGFDYLISRAGFSKVKGGQFQVDAP